MSDALVSAAVSAASGILGAIVGGLVAAWGAVRAVEKTSQDLELTEIRRQKVECIVALNGLRWVISDGGSPPDEYKAKLNYEMNKISPLWADDSEVMKNLRDFYAHPASTKSWQHHQTLNWQAERRGYQEHLSHSDDQTLRHNARQAC